MRRSRENDRSKNPFGEVSTGFKWFPKVSFRPWLSDLVLVFSSRFLTKIFALPLFCPFFFTSHLFFFFSLFLRIPRPQLRPTREKYSLCLLREQGLTFCFLVLAHFLVW